MQWIQFIRAAASGAYVPAGAIVLESGDSLTRALSTPTDVDVFFMAAFIKRSSFGAQFALAEEFDGSTQQQWRFASSDKMEYRSGAGAVLLTTQVFRDPTAWTHVAMQYNSNASGGSGDYHRFWVDGVEVTAFDTDSPVSAGVDCQLNKSGNTLSLFRDTTNAGDSFEGYVADVVVLDGQTEGVDFNITDLCTTDDNGNPIPVNPGAGVIDFSGANSAWLDFSNSGSLGTDASGNGNNFTLNSITSANSTSDRPMDDAENGVGNYCTLNPTAGDPQFNAATTHILGDGNLSYDENGDGDAGCLCSIAVSSGKWYFELEVIRFDAFTQMVGVHHLDGLDFSQSFSASGQPGTYYNGYSGQKVINGTSSAYGDTWKTNGDIIGVALDMDNGAIWFSKNGTWQNSATEGEIEAGTTTNAANTGLTGLTVPAMWMNDGKIKFNFGQTTFNTTPPSGFKALATQNLPAPSIADPSAHFQTVTYAGDGNDDRDITFTGNSTFQPDLVWIKDRDNAKSHQVNDSVRGTGKNLSSDSTGAEVTDADRLQAYNSNGFQVGTHTNVNASGADYVAWCWKAGGTASSNTDGTITSSVSANTTAGFSIVTYTGTAANATVGHGLGAAPDLIIVKNRTDEDAWAVYHSSNTAAPETDYLVLNTTAATADLNTYWNDTAPTSSVFSIGSVTNTNGSSDNMVAYCWAEIEGFSKFGSYTGNANADGPFIYLGFRPALVMIKKTSATSSWTMHDNARTPYNAISTFLTAETTDADQSGLALDFTSNGFKLRHTGGANSSGDWIYAAFAEMPFDPDGAAQVRAR